MSFDPSTSIRSGAPGVGTSLVEQLPSVQFGFDELRDIMAKFQVKADAFFAQKRMQMLESRTEFHNNIAEMEESIRLKRKEIEIIELETTNLKSTITKENAETKEMHDAISSLEAQRDHHISRNEALKRQISETRRDLEARLEAKRIRAEHLEYQARFNIPELEFWSSTLGLRIDGAGKQDRLKITYTLIDERDWDREAWFELEFAKRDYEVLHCRPKLEKEKVDGVLEKVNESRELGVLFKGMRELFVEAFRS